MLDAPVAFHRSLRLRVVDSDLRLAKIGLQYTISSFDPCFFFVFRKEGGAVGAFATHVDDILGRWCPDVLERTLSCFGSPVWEIEITGVVVCA